MEQNDLSRKQKIEILKAAQRGDRAALIDALNKDSELIIYLNLGNDQYLKGREPITKEQYLREVGKNSNSVTVEIIGGHMPPITSEKEIDAYFDRRQAAISQSNQ